MWHGVAKSRRKPGPKKGPAPECKALRLQQRYAKVLEVNLRPGSDRLYVVEADEYDRSFLAMSPTVAVVTNVEADHLDV